MRNLKKILSLALALIMALSLVTFANAAGTTDFSDDAEIDHPTAVNTLVNLGIIDGVGNNNFNPAGSVKRGELCKIIAVILNGGQEPVLDEGSSSFSDTQNHWARAYVEYCVAQGIVDGYGDGTFKPEQAVTGSEAAKMLLVAMGYNPEVFGLTGARWAVNVAVNANKAQLYKDILGTNPANPLNRDSTAQMTFNAIFRPTMTIEYGYDPATGKVTNNYTETGAPLFNDKFGGVQVEDVVLTGVTYNANKNTYTYSTTGSRSFVMADDYSELFGQTVTVLQRNGKKNNETDYGMFVSQGSVLVDAYASDISDFKADTRKITIAGAEYTTDARTIAVRPFNGDLIDGLNTKDGIVKTANGAGSLDGAARIKLVDLDGDGEGDVIVSVPFEVGTINYIGRDSFSFKAASTRTEKLADVVMYSGAAKDDVVIKTAAAYLPGSDDVYTQTDYASGSISGTKKDTDGADMYRIDGVWYRKAAQCTTSLNVGDTIDFVGYGTVIYLAKVTSGSVGTENLGMIYRAAMTAGGGTGGEEVEIRIILADGSKKTGILAKINGTKVGAAANADVTGTDYVGNSVTTDPVELIGAVVYWELVSGKYEVKTLPASYSTEKILGYDGTSAANAGYTSGQKAFSGTAELADDATVFVLKGTIATHSNSNDAKVYTGHQIKNSNTNLTPGTTIFTSSLYQSVNGFTYTKVAVGAVASDWLDVAVGANYGYLTADAYHTRKDGETWTTYELWTADGAKTVSEKKNQTLANFKAGTLITFDGSGDEAKDVKAANAQLSYISGYDGGNKVQINGASNTKTDSDTIILFVDSAKHTGIDGGSLAIADKNGSGAYINNVLYIPGSGENFALIVMDINNQFEGLSKVTLPNTATPAEINAALSSSDKVQVDAAKLTGRVDVEEGKTLDLSGSTADVTSTQLENIKGAGTVDLGAKPVTGYTMDSIISGSISTKAPALTAGGAANVTMETPALKGSGVVSGFNTSPDFEAAKTGSDTIQYLSVPFTEAMIGTGESAKKYATLTCYYTNASGSVVAADSPKFTTASPYDFTDGDSAGLIIAVGNKVDHYELTLYAATTGDTPAIDTATGTVYTINIK